MLTVAMEDLAIAHVDGDGLAWMDQALCAQVDTELFFPEKGASAFEATRLCRACDVRPECREYALARGERFGVWGGMTERERRQEARRRGLPDRGLDEVAA